MLEILNYLSFDPISTIVNGIAAIKNIRIEKIGEKALLEEVLEEFKDNLIVIKDDYIENECPVELIISVLTIRKLDKAENARKNNKLNFNNIKRGKIKHKHFISEYQRKYYSDCDTSFLILKLREKIKGIKKLKTLYFRNGNWNPKVNPKRRMKTIVDLLILFSRHLDDK